MRTLVYLFANRKQKFAMSSLHLKAWLKRAWHFPELIRLLLIRRSLRSKGARIGILSDCVGTEFLGSLRLLSIGDNSFVGKCKIMLHDSLDIGSSVVINDDVTILTASHLIDDPHFSQVSKPVQIDDYAWICTGASIMPGVHIGQAAIVAAFAVVSKNVAPFAVVAGNPAVCVKYRANSAFAYRPNLLRACYEAWVGLPWAQDS